MKDILFNRSIKEMSDFAGPYEKADSVPIEYKFNSYGYRCNEFDNQEILVLGCSQTEGHGLPLELTWPYLLSQKMNKDYISLAKGGDGMQAQVTKAFQFFKEFYKPKYIFAALPLTRLEVPLINIETINENNKGLPSNSGNIGKAMLSNGLNEKYSKAPHVIENVLPEEFAIFYNVLFMKMLIEYCKSNNIQLIWTYYNDSSLQIPSLKGISSGYFEGFHLNESVKERCHEDISDNKFFVHAADYDFWPPGHWGLHQQTHLAEAMYDMVDFTN